jgi:co-chaperonin GroES (HSP10)
MSGLLLDSPMIQPLRDQVLIKRIEEESLIVLTDAPKSIKGVILAVGPGKRDEDGELIPTEVKPGLKVLFNSKWNDFTAGENVGTGSDGTGPLERPLPLKADPMLHLVTEGDIIGIVPHFNFRASIKPAQISENKEIVGPWNGGNPNDGMFQVKHG